MRQIDRRLQSIREAVAAKGLNGLPPLYVRHVRQEDLRPYGATALEQARYDALIDQTNAYAQDLVGQHGPGILRDHIRNDAYKVLTVDELEFVEHMIVTYRPDAADAA